MSEPNILRKARWAVHRRTSPNWFISFPKSGRTWTKSIVEEYVRRRAGAPPFNYEDYAPWLRTGPWRQVPRLVFVHPHCRETDPGVTQAYIGSLRERNVVILVRDPREVVVTYYFRLRKRMRDARAASLSLSEFLRDEETGIRRVVDFTNAWFRTEGRFHSRLFLRFEDVQAEPEKEISRFLKFLQIPVDKNLLNEVISSTPDRTTRAIEDESVVLTPADLAFLDEAARELDPALGYQVD